MREDTKMTIDNYVNLGWEPGGFITAVLSNDLKEAFSRADIVNRAAMFEIVSYCYNSIPSTCWGSPEKVTNWLNKFKNKENN